MSSQEKIAPCPFCGGKAVAESFQVRKGWEAEAKCNGGCLASIRSITWDEEDEAVESAIAAWNRRAPSEREKAREAVIEAAKRHMDDLGAFEAEDGDRRGHAEAMDESAKELVTALEALAALGDA